MFVEWNLGFWSSQPGLYVRSHVQLGRIVSLYLRRALLSRNDRYGHGSESVAYTNADAHPHTCADSDTYSHIYTDASPISYPDRNAYAHIYTRAYADRYSDGDGRAYADGDSDADGHTYTHSHTDAMHRKMHADAEACSDSGAASDGTASDGCHVHSRSYAEPRTRGSCSYRG